MPKFPGVLLNNNPNAPSLDLNDLQVKGVGIFADVSARDALDVNIQTEGYLSIMKNDDNVYVYKGGGWTTPANWEKISGTIGFTDSDGNPLGEVSTLVFPEGSISIVGTSGVVDFTADGTSTDTTNFNGVLSSADTTVQAALDTLDGLSLTLEGLGDTPSGYGTAGQVLITNGVDGFTFGSGSPWEEVSGTTTDIKYEDGSVGVKDSATLYETETGNKIGTVKSRHGSTFPGNQNLLHLHEGRLGLTTIDSNNSVDLIKLDNGHHSAASGASIGLKQYGFYVQAQFSMEFRVGSETADFTITNIGNWSNGAQLGPGGLFLPGGTLGSDPDLDIKMAGGIIFYNHTSNEFYGLKPIGFASDLGLQLGAKRSGLFASFRSSDQNTEGSYGYLGINVNTPSATGPAFEVSSSYGKFNNGLHIGDITTTGYAFPTATGAQGQLLQVDANGDLGFVTFQGSPWEEVAYTGQTAIKYENGVVGIKASGTTYSTNSNLLAKAGQFPINTGSYSTTLSGVDALMHLHEGRIIYTTDNSATGAVAMSMLGTSHATTDIGQIGLYNRKAWISGGEGVYLGSSSVNGISTHITSPGTSGIVKIGSQNFDTSGGIQLSGDTGPASNYHKIVMGGQIIFHGHTASKYVAISRRGAYGTDGGVQISGGLRTGLFAHFAASDPNTQGTYGYLGINVNTPTVGGPAFEVSSSYAKFNNGLHIGDITATGYAFPTATGTTGQLLQVDANGDLGFVTFQGSPWTADTNGITYTAGNVGIGTSSVSNKDLTVGNNIDLLEGEMRFLGVSTGIKLQAAFNTTAGVGIGYQAFASGGTGSVAIGNRVGSPSSGTVVIGYSSQQMAYTAADPRAVHIGHSAGMTATSATDTIAIGNSPLSSLTTGNGNLAIGRTAGSAITTESYNTFIGYEAGRTNTGSSNVFIGKEAGEFETGSNKLYISNSNTTTPLIYGEFDNNIVKINGSYSGGAIGFFPQNGNQNGYVAIGDQNYFDAGFGGSSAKGLHLLFNSTFANTGYGTGVQIGHSWNMGYFGQDNVAIGNRFTSTATNAQHIPKIMIGNGIDLGTTNNNSGGILIGPSSVAGNMGGGVVIGGTGAAFNGVAILANGHEGSQGGTAILGEVRGYAVTIGAAAGKAGVGSTLSGQKVYVGINAGNNSNVTTAIGANAGRNLTGSYNTALGSNSLGAAVSSGGVANTAVGDSAGYNVTGSGNTFVGARAAINTTSGGSNVALGGGLGAGSSPALNANTNGSHNISLGINSLETAVSASRNIALGTDSGKRAGGSDNIFLGYRIAYVGTSNNTSIYDNIVLGSYAGYNLASYGNILLGREAGDQITTGSRNVSIGHQSGSSLAVGSENVFVGYVAGNNYTGDGSVFIGRRATATAGLANTRAVAIGYNASVTGAKGVAIGASVAAASGVAIGVADARASEVSIGQDAGRLRGATEGGLSVFIGYSSGLSSSGSQSVIIGGLNAGTNSSLGGSIGVGNYAWSSATASQSIAIGTQSGRGASGNRNVYIGDDSGRSVTGDDNVILGDHSVATARSVSGSVFLGKDSGDQETTSNKLYIANSNTATPLIYGEFDNSLVKINGDLEATGSNGLTLTSPNGTRYKVTVTDAGALSVATA